MLHREALVLRPAPHPDRSSSISNLAIAIGTRFDQIGMMKDLDESIMLCREGLVLCPAPYPDRSNYLNNLAQGLCVRFAQLRQLPDLEESIIACRESIHLLPWGHPNHCLFSGTLGSNLMDMYFHTQQAMHLDDAMAAFHTAVTCESAPAFVRLRMAENWAHHADDSKHSLALKAYQYAIKLLPRLATLSLDLQSRQQILLSGSDGLARNAAACAIQSGHFDQAVEFLEEGRNIFWSQSLQLRTPLNQLHLVAPNLAKRLQDISKELELGAFRKASTNLSDLQLRVSFEQEAVYFRRLDREWLKTVEEIQKLDGFDTFLCPKPLAKLQRAAANGPVVILNSSKSGCDALILTSSGVEHVPLSKCTVKIVWLLVRLIRDASNAGRVALSKPQLRALMQQTQDLLEPLNQDDQSFGPATRSDATPDDVFQNVLEILWTLVARPVIHCLALTKSELPSRLWWCPTGPFTFLPIHAAGIYNKEDGERVSDYVISSYTPTLNTLLTPTTPPINMLKMMAVIQPYTPGYPPLPFTHEELLKIEKHVPEKCLVKLGIPESFATVKNVLKHLSTVSIVHLACHGVQDTMNPLESALILNNNERLKISQIMEQPMSNASLAFLSACETAMGDENLPDEAIHLAASLLFAGFHGTVATMWTIFDEDGPKIADSFYGHLFQTNISAMKDTPILSPNTAQAALALHMAVAKLREEGCSFKRWIPFIHLGL